ncbi:hypothetical protein RJ55_00557 [Drechmeria coniospora]|nr:hypothetical protein RJ55_00557 [Drechmeria coniospora]
MGTAMASPRRPTPMVMLLGAIFFFSSHVLAVAAVLGVDLGTEYIKAALVKPGIPLEIVLTKDSRRKEASAVAFKPSDELPEKGKFPERFYGSDAMAVAARFPGEVYPNLRTLLGLPIDDAIVQEYAARHPALYLEAHGSRKTASFRSSLLPADADAWMIEELLAMELQSIQKNAEVAAGGQTSVRSVVLTVPPFYTAEEKRAIRMAAELAGLKVLSLISDGLAVGLHYATGRQFPNINEGAKPEFHLVFDMGAGSTTATVMRFQSRSAKDVGKFNKTVQEIQVLGSGWDRTLGGDSLNYLIMDDMVSKFVESDGARKISATVEGVKSHGRAMAKIAKEAERMRHVLSANQDTQAGFEGLYEDVDFKYKITRVDFEAMADGYADRVKTTIGDAMKMSGLDIDDLESIILHGGLTRTPFIQKVLEEVVRTADKLRSNVNADEAAVFGAGFRAAEISPSFRVKEIRISEGTMYPAGIKWTAGSGKTQRQRLWTASSVMGGPAKEMTFTNKADFAITFYQQVDGVDNDIKTMTTTNLTKTLAAVKAQHPTCVDDEAVFKVSVKTRSENGEVQVMQSYVECEIEVAEKDGFVDGVKNLFGFGKKGEPSKDAEESGKGDDSKKPQASNDGVESSTSTTSTASADSSAPSGTESKGAAASDEATPPKKKKKIISIPVGFVLSLAGNPSLSKSELAAAKNRIEAFAASDRARIQREEALNMLEGFAYKISDLVEGDDFITASTEAERAAMTVKASEFSEWIYGDGVGATTAELKAKLKVLQDLVHPVQKRIEEAEKRPEMIALLQSSMNDTNLLVSFLRKQLSDYESWKVSASAASASKSSSTASPSSEPASESVDDSDEEDGTAKSGEKAKDDAGTDKTGKKAKDDTDKTGKKAKDDADKTGKKAKGDTDKTGKKAKGDTDKTGKKAKVDTDKTEKKAKDDTDKTGKKAKDDDDAAAKTGKTAKRSGGAAKGGKKAKHDEATDQRPPTYTNEDVDKLEALQESTAKWLKAMEVKQASLPPTADPTLVSQDLEAKAKQLKEARANLARQSIKYEESKKRRARSRSQAGGKKKAKSAGAQVPLEPIDFNEPVEPLDPIMRKGKNGPLTSEELKEIVEEFEMKEKKEKLAKAKVKGSSGDKEQSGKAGEERPVKSAKPAESVEPVGPKSKGSKGLSKEELKKVADEFERKEKEEAAAKAKPSKMKADRESEGDGSEHDEL